MPVVRSSPRDGQPRLSGRLRPSRRFEPFQQNEVRARIYRARKAAKAATRTPSLGPALAAAATTSCDGGAAGLGAVRVVVVMKLKLEGPVAAVVEGSDTDASDVSVVQSDSWVGEAPAALLVQDVGPVSVGWTVSGPWVVRVTRLCDISVASLVGVADPESSDGSVGQPAESQVFEVSVTPLVEGSEVSVDVADCIVVEISGETVGSVVNDTVSDEDDSDVVVDVACEQPRGSQVLDVSAALSVEVAGSEVVGVSVDGVDSEAVEVFVIEVSVDEAVEVSVDEVSSVVSVALLVVVDGEVGDSIELVSAVVVDGTELVVVLVTTQGMGTIVVIVIVFVVVIVVVVVAVAAVDDVVVEEVVAVTVRHVLEASSSMDFRRERSNLSHTNF
ncbi:hypothetical protein PCL_06944 [Purpureocillium lilacinum]|uniref:Uncharacterized protein n=1 Tax=Purpureocillium lilacinum TaxID=33203 RepID=A0A2U3DTE1_PURLI|nr:hypothetical protein PCL_06944 [Purpureocillium lilacinum]